MKTTIDIQDPLLAQAKQLAHQERKSVKALIEEGLRRVFTARTATDESRFEINQFVHHGEPGFAPGFSGEWEAIKQDLRSSYSTGAKR